MRRVTILVCGEPLRGDDAVADAIVDALSPSTRAMAEVRYVGALMPDDLLAAGGPVIVVDAIFGPPPGEVVDLPLSALRSVTAKVEIGSSHSIPLPAVVALAERMAGQEVEGRFIGIAGETFGHGEALSPTVADALPRCAARLAHWIRVLAHARPVATCA
jgi:hydrogenase maturation protease